MADQTTTIPKGWKMTTLGEVVDLAQGVAINAKTDFVLCGKEEGLPLLKINNLLNETVDMYANPKLVTKKAILNKEDVIFTRTGQVGWVFTGKEGILHNNSFKVIPHENVYGKFLYWFLKQQSIFDYVQRVASGSAQPDLNHDAFKTITIELPHISEQRAIAAVLSSLDDKIELLREQNKTLEATAQAIFKEWFVSFNFPNEEGKPYKASSGKMIDSELGKIPEGWRVGRLGDAIELHDSKRIPLASDVRAKRKGQYPYYGATSIMDYIDDYLFDGTYLLLAEDGSVMDNNGRPVLQYVWGKFWVSNHAHVIQGKNGFSTEMLQVLLKNANIAGIVNGAVQLKINQANLLSFEILIPTKGILRSFDSILQPIFQKIKNITSQIQNLSKLRDTLLPKLMKGEVRVKGLKN